MRKKQIWAKSQLEGGSESFQRSEDGWFSRENSKAENPSPCLAHSTQLLGLPPSGPLPFLYYREPSLILTVRLNQGSCLDALRASKHITMALKYWWQYISINMCKVLTEHQALCWYCSWMISSFNSHQPHKKIRIYITSFYRKKWLQRG